MPLLDHFHPPLSTQRHWESFHTTWAGAIADALNEQWLPEGYFAEEQLQPSARVEVDVATFEEEGRDRSSGGVAVAGRKTWMPAAPTWTMPGLVPEGLEVFVFSGEGGPTLVGAIELISPANKDRAATRRAFAAKCASYLHQGIGLLIVDVVTSRSANLHNEVVELLDQPADYRQPPAAALYAVAYRPLRRHDEDWIEVWPVELGVGRALPELPLWLGPDLVVPVNLESTYGDACQRRRLVP
ncbi:MAG: DUF4058 family protein [Planctomycetaceae bacterium]|nr:DUF4058 family protein [Planctomycetaceae bacterium]